VNEINSHRSSNRQSRPDRPIRVLLMIASMDGGGSEQQTLLLLRHLDRSRFRPELYLLRRSGSLLAQVPSDVPVHCFEDQSVVDRSSVADRSADRSPDASPSQVQPAERSSTLVAVQSIQTAISRLCSSLQRRFNWPGKIHRAQVRHVAQLLQQRQIDVVYDRTFLMTLIAAPAAAKVGVPRVSTIVSPPSRIVPLLGGRFLAAKRRRLRRAYATSAAVVAVSHPTACDAAAYYSLPRRRFQVIPNPVDSAALDAVVAGTAAPPRDRRWTIACVGRMSAEKGQATLIDALDILKQKYPADPLPCLWMIGDGELRESLQRLVESRGLARHVHFWGHLAQPAPWIAAADALCLPSHFEGFPNVMLEAMALGTPVIARSIDVTRSLGSLAQQSDIRGRDYLALFDTAAGNDAESLARKIRRVQFNTTATRSRVQAARRLAREAHALSHLLPRIEYLLFNASANSWQRRQRG